MLIQNNLDIRTFCTPGADVDLRVLRHFAHWDTIGSLDIRAF